MRWSKSFSLVMLMLVSLACAVGAARAGRKPSSGPYRPHIDPADFQTVIDNVTREIRKVIIGQDDAVRYSLVVVLCNQHALIEGVPVQFLPAYNALLEEALDDAQEIMYEDVPARVLRSEHLLAICLQTGRSKDRERARILREQAQLDQNFLADVLRRYQLEDKWKLWTE